MLGTTPQGLLFLKQIQFSEVLGRTHFEEIACLLIFGQNVNLDTARDSQEALRKLSGGSQEALGRLSEAISVSKVLEQL